MFIRLSFVLILLSNPDSLALFVLLPQPEDGPGSCLEAAYLQPSFQHQAVHNGPGKALFANVGAS